MKDIEFAHVTVLKNQAADILSVTPGGIYVDATLGGAGHSGEILKRLQNKGVLYAFDRDMEAISVAQQRLIDFENKFLINANFSDLEDQLLVLGVSGVDGFLFDLGVSSYQLDSGERGFSYRLDAPLDMRMDQSQVKNAQEVINTYTKEQLEHILFTYGEERYSKRIVASIIEHREIKKIETTLELVDIIKSAMPGSALREPQHPAKRVFQAIRIEVNSELQSLEIAIHAAIKMLNPGGVVAVITFHSLEDRIVKTIFNKYISGCTCPRNFPVCVCGFHQTIQLVNKKPIEPTTEECIENPRARSAKLRAARKL